MNSIVNHLGQPVTITIYHITGADLKNKRRNLEKLTSITITDDFDYINPTTHLLAVGLSELEAYHTSSHVNGNSGVQPSEIKIGGAVMGMDCDRIFYEGEANILLNEESMFDDDYDDY